MDGRKHFKVWIYFHKGSDLTVASIAWGKEHVAKFIKTVVPPYEEKKGFDDRIAFDEALVLATQLGEDGLLLMEALESMRSAAQQAKTA